MIHVYVGPTLDRSEPLLNRPQVRVHPPVQHGDLLTHAIGEHDTVVIIDGLYHQASALKHKEILATMGRGISVIGAASLGALRAAELDQCGMIGVGDIYRSFASGEIDGDDEAAVGQAPDGDMRALTWPVVNLRYVLAAAESQRIISKESSAALLAELRSVYYANRSTAAVLAICRRLGAEGQTFGGWLKEQRSRIPLFGDLKRIDAVVALGIALHHRPQGVLVRSTWNTTYFRKWANALAYEEVGGLRLATTHRLIYQQLFDPQFPGVWLAYLDHLSRHPGDGSCAMPLAERMARITDERPGNSSPLPPHAVFRPSVDLRAPDVVAQLLVNETAEDRTTIARYTENNREAGAGFTLETIRDDVALRALLDLWDVHLDQLENEAVSRGFHHGAHATEGLKTFLIGYRVDAQAAQERRVTTDAK